jgi:hypothetical protein
LIEDFVSAVEGDVPDAPSPGPVVVGESTSTTASSVSSSVVGVAAADPSVEVCAPPVLLKFMSGTVGPGAEPPPAEPLWPVVDCWVSSAVAGDVAVLSFEGVDVEGESLSESAVDDESEPSSARAIPAPLLVASAAPTPSATASAPMRPTYRA